MKPILFAENSTVFTSNGIGRLSDAVSCTVTEERNGMYELEMVYPSTGVHFEDIAIRSIIVVLPYIGASLQPFRVYQITRPINGQVTIRAQHISYDLSKNTTMPFSVQASVTACNDALQGLKANAVETCPFTFWTDVTTNASYSQTAPATIRSRLGGVEGSILDQFHGEYEWDVYTVKFHDERGADNGVVLRYGKNITDIKQDTNIANTITGVVPYWVNHDGTERVTLPEKVVYAPNASAYSQHLTVPLDFSSNYQEAPTESALRAAAQAYINNHDLGVPKVSVDVSFVNLADTEEYKDEVNMLQTVHLCDEITVEFESLGISTKAQIVKYEWDVLGEKYNNLSVGSIRSSLVTTLNDQNAQLMEQIVKAGQSSAEATSWLTQFGGYVVAIKDENGNWVALAFSDDPDPTKNTANVLLVNQNGLGFSSTGIYGTFTNAWTIDGKLSADFIQAGTMQADRINGGILKLGGIDNTNGVLSILSAPDLEIGRWDKNGIRIMQGTISGTAISGGTITGTTISGGTVNGTTINWGSDTHTAQMTWAPIVGDVGSLKIETANANDTIEMDTKSVIVDGALSVVHTGATNLPILSVDGDAAITGILTVKGNRVVRDVLDTKVNLGTFESNGQKYLAVYHGTTSYGSVLLS